MNAKFKLLPLLTAIALIVSLASCKKETVDSSSASPSSKTESASESAGDASAAASDDDILVANSNTSSATSSGKAANVSSKDNTEGQYNVDTGALTSPQEKKFKSLKGTTVKFAIAVGPEDQGAGTKQFFEMVEKRYGVKIEFEIMSDREQRTKIGQMVAAGNPPDACYMFDVTMLNYVYGNVAQPIDQYLAKDDPIWAKGKLDAFKINNKTYGIPQGWDMPEFFVYYNETLFKEKNQKTPTDYYKEGNWTFAAFLDTAKKMTEFQSDGKTVKTAGVGTWYYNVFNLANGGKSVSETSPGKFQVTIDKPNEMEALSLLYNLVQANALYTGDSYAGFAQRKIAMHIERPQYAIGNYNYYVKMSDKIGMAPLPKSSDGKYYAPQINTGQCIPKNAKNPLGGMMILYEKYRYDKERLLVTKDTPGVTETDLALRRGVISDEHLKLYTEYLKIATPISSYLESISGWETSEIRNQFWNPIIVEKKQPAVAVDSMKSTLQSALKRTTG